MKKADIKALQFGSRFTLPPNSLGYCGRGTAPEKFKDCVINCNCEGIGEEFTKFIVLYPYLKTLSTITKLPFTSGKVMEAYWLGNNQLKKAKLKHYDILLKNFAKQGVPDWLVEELKTKRPKVFIPSHLFQILHVGVGRASGSVPFNIESSNNCMIRWGKVKSIKGDSAMVMLNSLKEAKKGYKLTKLLETHPFIPQFLPNLKKGDTVAVHWKQIVKVLTKDEEGKVEFWTKEVLKTI